jgi:hypothetical protein
MSNIVELRQYTLKPGQRDTLIELFEREFIETQEAEGMDVIGIFRDLDEPDRFVWLRGFPDMKARAKSLAAFYGGPVWKRHRETANATMIDSDNVLLLRPAWSGADFANDRLRSSTSTALAGIVTVAIYYFGKPLADRNIEEIRDQRHSAGDTRVANFAAAFVTEPASNDFPGLPVREGESVFVCISVGSRVDLQSALRIDLPPGVNSRLSKPVEFLRLEPTRRSRLRGG